MLQNFIKLVYGFSSKLVLYNTHLLKCEFIQLLPNHHCARVGGIYEVIIINMGATDWTSRFIIELVTMPVVKCDVEILTGVYDLNSSMDRSKAVNSICKMEFVN